MDLEGTQGGEAENLRAEIPAIGRYDLQLGEKAEERLHRRRGAATPLGIGHQDVEVFDQGSDLWTAIEQLKDSNISDPVVQTKAVYVSNGLELGDSFNL